MKEFTVLLGPISFSRGCLGFQKRTERQLLATAENGPPSHQVKHKREWQSSGEKADPGVWCVTNSWKVVQDLGQKRSQIRAREP